MKRYCKCKKPNIDSYKWIAPDSKEFAVEFCKKCEKYIKFEKKGGD